MTEQRTSADEVRRSTPTEMRQTSNFDRRQKWHIDVNQSPYELALADMDPGNPMLYAADKHWQHFARLRQEAPVHYCPHSQFGPYWSITRFDDCMYVDSHHELFSSDAGIGGIQLGGRVDPDLDPNFHLPMFIMSDRPKHDVQRKIVAPAFSMRNLVALETIIRDRAADILDHLPISETFNWVTKVSMELTGQMLAILFGIPLEDRHKLIYWSDATQNMANPEYFTTVEEGFKELWKCWEYFAEVWALRKQSKTPGEDLISMLVHGESTKNMPPNEYLGNILLLIVGGNDTTRNSISGSVLALNRYPDQYDKLKANPELISSMVPEAIRWQTPLSHMARTALVDTELAGQLIKAKDRVVMWYISGNRDESVIHEPDKFIIDRANPRHHLSFGYGIHRCVGNRLADMQLQVIWEEIMKRFSHVEVVGEPVYQQSNFIHGILDLPVKLHR